MAAHHAAQYTAIETSKIRCLVLGAFAPERRKKRPGASRGVMKFRSNR
jgi:hypothetical protein